jgi:hypothetical protein
VYAAVAFLLRFAGRSALPLRGWGMDCERGLAKNVVRDTLSKT